MEAFDDFFAFGPAKEPKFDDSFAFGPAKRPTFDDFFALGPPKGGVSHRWRRVRVGRGLGTVATLVLLAALAVIPALADHVIPGPPSGNGEQPIGVHDNPSCATVLAESDFLFERKQEPPADASIPLSFGALTGSVTVDVRNVSQGQVFDFTFTGDFVAAAVIVKGGPDANLYDYRPGGEDADTSLHAPVNPQNRRFFGLSHISFCVAQARAELRIEKDPDPSEPGYVVNAGSTAAFTVTVTSLGPATATSVVIDDTLPAGFTWSTTTAGCTITGGTVLHCDVGSLAKDATFAVTVTAPTTVDDCGAVRNPDAMADASNTDPVTDSGEISIQCGAIRINKDSTKGGPVLRAGATFGITPHPTGGTGTLTVADNGANDDDPAVGRVCVEPVIPGVAYTVTETAPPSGYGLPATTSKTATPSGGSSCASAAATVAFSNPPLADLLVRVDGQVPGEISSTITCVSVGSAGPADPAVIDRDGLVPGTYTCEIVIDP